MKKKKTWDHDHPEDNPQANIDTGCARHQFDLDGSQGPPWEGITFQGRLTSENNIEIISTCGGDSGGPVLKRHSLISKNNFTIVGIVFGGGYKDHFPQSIVSVIRSQSNTGCTGEDSLGLASSVWVHRDWIAQAKIAFEQGLHQITPISGSTLGTSK